MAERAKTSVWGLVGIGALVFTGCLVVIVLITFMFGYVSGAEFNPDTFSRRQFGFFEIPLVRLQVTPLFRTESDGEVAALVKAQKYVTTTKPNSDEWHLVSFARSGYPAPPTDVQILTRYLDASDHAQGTYWHEWSIRNPEMAAVLWPEVGRLARLNLYVLLPPLFDLADNAEDAKTLQTELARLQSAQLQDTAERWQKRSESTTDEQRQAEQRYRIAQLFQAASQLQPDDAMLQAQARQAVAALLPEQQKQLADEAQQAAAELLKATTDKAKDDEKSDSAKSQP